MAGIFSRGFGFPSTSLAAAAEATAKGSAGSRAGAGPRPSRRPPPARGKKNPRVGELGAIRRARLRDAGMRRRTGRGAQLVPPGQMLQPGLTPFLGGLLKGSGRSGVVDCGNSPPGTRGLDAHINLSLRLGSEEAPLEEKRRGRTPAAPGGAAVSGRGRERAARGGKERAEEEREGGCTEPKTSPRGSCRPDPEHRSVACYAEAQREPSKGISRRNSHHCPEAPQKAP